MAEQNGENNKNNPGLRAFISNLYDELFNLQIDKASNQDIIDDIRKDSVFKGPNLWILIFAIIICSIGLDVNSTAVIIGGMLISPLMGPLIGVGLSISRFDLELLKKSSFNIFVAIILSVITSFVYFLISPLNKAQSELLSRTSPAIWDVLIAFAGGLAGIIAYTRKEKSNVIPGVAIATALMPPLATAGFGLASGNFQYFYGAMYLFAINSIFIILGTYIVIKILGIRRKKYLEPKIEKRAKWIVILLIFLIIIPSVITGVNMVRQSSFEKNAEKFIKNEFHPENTIIISHKINYKSNPKKINIVLYGKQLDSQYIKKMKEKMTDYNLQNTDLIINQGKTDDNLEFNISDNIKNDIKSEIVEDIYNKSNAKIQDQSQHINELQNQLIHLKSKDIPIVEIGNEAKILFPVIKKISSAQMIHYNTDSNVLDTVPTFMIYSNSKVNTNTKERLENWLRVKSGKNQIEVIYK